MRNAELERHWPWWMQGEGEGILPPSIHSQGYANALIVKTGPGRLFGFTVYNSGAAQFILLLDAAQIPADGFIPCVPLKVAATDNLGVSYYDVGRAFNTGIIICNSSTAPTKTIGAADCFFDAQYL